jgi:hypothetical protein
MTLPKLALPDVGYRPWEGEVMTTANTLHSSPISREARPPQPSAPEHADEVLDDPVAEALAFARRISAQVRRPGEATPLGVQRVA